MESELKKVLINSYKEEMIAFLKSHPKAFDEAIELALGNGQPFCWRSAWLVWSCIEENDERIKPHVKRIIDAIPEKKDGHQRELLKIILVMDLDEDYEGIVFDLAMNLWETIGKSPSIRITAFKFILKMAKKYPDIAVEIPYLVEDHFLDTLSPGIRHSVKRLMAEFEE